MRYFVIAGEESGDLHGGNLINEISGLDPGAVYKGVGGKHLQASGVNLLFGLERLSFMGFFEVFKNLHTIRKNFSEVKKEILSFQPDVVILIDYPGFNLRMARWCKHHGIKVVYYIVPQIWAWHTNRIKVIKRNVDLALCILPFEEEFYRKHHYEHAHFVGHPLLDIIERHPEQSDRHPELLPVRQAGVSGPNTIIALLPGSRKQEIKKLLPLMLETTRCFPKEQFVIAGISRLKELYPGKLPQNVTIYFDNIYEVLQQAKAAVVCSGTATLETALYQVPQVVLYKTSWLNYQIGKRLAKVNFISLPNLIVNKKFVTELLQEDCTTQKICDELQSILNSTNQQFYNSLIEKIGEKGASAKAAKIIFKLAGDPYLS